MYEALLKQGRNDQLSWMSCGGFEKDTSGAMDDYEGKDTGNTGLSNRYKKTKTGKKKWNKVIHGYLSTKPFIVKWVTHQYQALSIYRKMSTNVQDASDYRYSQILFSSY